MNYACIQTKKIGMEALRNTGTKEINNIVNSMKLVEMTKDNNGKIESIDFNTSLINEVSNIVSKNVKLELNKLEKKNNKFGGLQFEIPLGIIFGNSFLSNKGPKIPVRIKFIGNVGIDIKTRVKEYGLIPFVSKEIKITSEDTIIKKVIKGDVPNYITGYNRTYSLPIK